MAKKWRRGRVYKYRKKWLALIKEKLQLELENTTQTQTWSFKQNYFSKIVTKETTHMSVKILLRAII